MNDAERSLCWLRGWVKPDDVKQELDDLVSTLSTHGNKIPICKRPEWKHYTKKTFVKVLFFIIITITYNGTSDLLRDICQ